MDYSINEQTDFGFCFLNFENCLGFGVWVLGFNWEKKSGKEKGEIQVTLEKAVLSRSRYL